MTYLMQPYDDALQYILDHGELRLNRTNVDTLSIFGMQMRYRIDEYFPFPTKRKLFPKAIWAELLWMLSGSTNVNDLEALGSKIWTAWKDPEFEKRNGYSPGELGAIYGWSMRNFGAKYEPVTRYYDYNTAADYVIDPPREPGRGFDQISYIVNELKNNKRSRRILMNLWDPNVATTDKVKLPPCHVMYQFNVDNQDRLSCMLSQRSGDMPAGIWANVCFTSTLTYMLAQQCDLKPYEVVHSIADSHIYVDQVDAVKEYLSRPEVPSPKLKLNKAKDIFSYQLSDFELVDYNPLPSIKVPVAV